MSIIFYRRLFVNEERDNEGDKWIAWTQVNMLVRTGTTANDAIRRVEEARPHEMHQAIYDNQSR